MNDSPRRTTIEPVRLAIMQVVVLVLIAFASSSAYLTRHCLAVANSQIQDDLAISPKQMGWVLGAWTVGYMIFQIPGGWLGDRFGTRSAFAGISALWSLFTIWTSWATSYMPMLLSRVAFGSAQAGLVPLSAKVVKDWMPPSLRGSSSAVVAAAMSIGGVVTMWLTARLMVEFDNNWRFVLQMYSIVGIAWAVVFFALFRTRPEEHPWLKGDDPGHLDDQDGEDHNARRLRPAGDSHGAQPAGLADREPTVSGGELLARMIRSPTMWAICMQSVLRAAGYSLLVTWTVYLLEHAYGLDKQSAGTMNMYPLIGVVIGSLFGGVLVDLLLKLTGSKRLSRSGLAVVVLAVCGAFTVLAARETGGTGFVNMMSVAAFFFGISQPTAWSATLDVAGRNTSIVMGTMNMAGCIGAFCLPVGAGYLIDRIEAGVGDWDLVIYVAAAIHFAAAISWLFVNPNDTTIIGD